MLPRRHRLTRPRDFTAVLRGDGTTTRRRRAGTPLLVVHCATSTHPTRPPRVGFVVSRAVGNSVVRHRVTRRLRHLVAERVSGLAPTTDLVVRAHPAAATATFSELGSALDRALTQACRGPQ